MTTIAAKNNNIPGILIGFSVIIITEVMFFGGIISAYLIANSRATDWPPVDQPRLPLYVSLLNMLLLLASGFCMNLFVKKLKNDKAVPILLNLAIVLGIVFLVIQGFEWIKLVNFGIISSNGLYASYFYSIIALHGFHVLIGIVLLLAVLFKFKNKFLENRINISAFNVFWVFVCLLWPILYFLLYLY